MGKETVSRAGSRVAVDPTAASEMLNLEVELGVSMESQKPQCSSFFSLSKEGT